MNEILKAIKSKCNKCGKITDSIKKYNPNNIVYWKTYCKVCKNEK
jgi:hypothetical protein